MKRTIKIGLLLLVMSAVVGCATMGKMGLGSWGSFVPDTTVLRNFESGNLDPDMNYYFSGTETSPAAIMGLSKAYALDNNLWKPIANPAMCMELVKKCEAEDLKDNIRDVQGFRMISPDGKTIGTWLSPIFSKMRFKMGEGNKVVVYTPDQPSSEDYYDYKGGRD